MMRYIITVAIIALFLIIFSVNSLAFEDNSSFENYYRSYLKDKNYSSYEELAYFNAYLSWLYEQQDILGQNIKRFEKKYNQAVQDQAELKDEIGRIEERIREILNKLDSNLR